jgi:GT2 family glycosyltransferase
MPEISVVVLNWNGRQFLEDCLLSLRRQTFRDFETILVDNGSTDGSVAYVSSRFPEATVEALADNAGFVQGNLAGYQRATGDAIVLLNNDTESHPRFLEEIHRATELFPQAGSFASKMLYFEERGRVDNCGSEITAAGTSIDVGRDDVDGPKYADYRWVFGGCGGAIGYRRKMLDDVGFLDRDLFMVYEDLDLSFRAQLRGYPCVFVPGAIVFHHYHGTVKRSPGKYVFYSQRNIETVYLKNMPLALMVRSLPQRVLYELGAAAYFCRMGAGMAFVKAKVDVVRQLPRILEKRREIQRRKTISNQQLRAVMKGAWIGERWTKFLSAWRGPSRGSVETRASSLFGRDESTSGDLGE